VPGAGEGRKGLKRRVAADAGIDRSPRVVASVPTASSTTAGVGAGCRLAFAAVRSVEVHRPGRCGSEMAGRGVLRASDADRERAADRLRRAAAEGRLVTDELEQRLEAAFSARTYAQLDVVLADLPGRRLTPPQSRPHVRAVPPAVVAAIAVPVVIAAIIVVVLVVTGVFAGWVLWLAAGWWFFGRHRRRCFPGRRYPGPVGGRRLAP
jgi:Domain of unknown function (DUF1707)